MLNVINMKCAMLVIAISVLIATSALYQNVANINNIKCTNKYFDCKYDKKSANMTFTRNGKEKNVANTNNKKCYQQIF